MTVPANLRAPLYYSGSDSIGAIGRSIPSTVTKSRLQMSVQYSRPAPPIVNPSPGKKEPLEGKK